MLLSSGSLTAKRGKKKTHNKQRGKKKKENPQPTEGKKENPHPPTLLAAVSSMGSWQLQENPPLSLFSSPEFHVPWQRGILWKCLSEFLGHCSHLEALEPLNWTGSWKRKENYPTDSSCSSKNMKEWQTGRNEPSMLIKYLELHFSQPPQHQRKLLKALRGSREVSGMGTGQISHSEAPGNGWRCAPPHSYLIAPEFLSVLIAFPK